LLGLILQKCLLCHEIGFSILSFQHLGRNLEELALFAIPRPAGDDDIDSDKSKHSSRRNTPFQAEQVDLSNDEGEDWLEQTDFADKTQQVPTNDYFLPKGNINLEVITANINRYVGPNASVRPYQHQDVSIAVAVDITRLSYCREEKGISSLLIGH
jgi:hypothetical protein